jgi:hypothetical protein
MSDDKAKSPIPKELGFHEVRSNEITIGGVLFNLTEFEHADALRAYRPRYRHSDLSLPIDMVTGMANASYAYPGEEQQILAALTPFQIISKLWANQIVGKAVTGEQSQIEEQFIFPGAWYGQQMALLRRNTRVRMLLPLLIDMDKNACSICRSLLAWDPYARGRERQEATLIKGDVFDQEMDQFVEWTQRSPTAIYVWNGLEHFDPQLVRQFMVDNDKATFCVQSTNMPADDHKFMCKDIYDLLDYVPTKRRKAIQYAGQIESPFGSRFMVMFDAI